MHIPAALQNEADKASAELEVRMCPNSLHIALYTQGSIVSS
jgi:hypothetical protein